MSNARRDRHLGVSLVPEGLELEDTSGLEVVGMANPPPVYHAPVKLQTDYGDSTSYGLFVSDVALGWRDQFQIGDVVTAINGSAVPVYLKSIEPYIRYSTVANLWWRFAEFVPVRSAELPPGFYSETLWLTMAGEGDQPRVVSLPYLHPDSLAWTDAGEPQYPAFSLFRATGTFDLYQSDGALPVTVFSSSVQQ